MGEPARLRLKVRHYELDAYGHVNHATYVHYLEVGRIEALEAIGLGLPTCSARDTSSSRPRSTSSTTRPRTPARRSRS